jgi:large conductance mechanosensitive channel
MLKGFKTFIMRGNVVDLAVAVVVGTAFTTVVKAFVADILTPLIAAIAGKPNFENLTFTINHSKFLYGDLVNALVTFLLVGAAVYLFVVYPLNRLAERRARRMAEGQPEDTTEVPPDVALLTEIRDILASQSGDGATAKTVASPGTGS